MSWTEPVNSLSAAQCTVANTLVSGSVIDLHEIMTQHAIQVKVVQAVTGQSLVYLLGSFDNVDWWNLVTSGQPAYLSPATSSGTFITSVTISGPARYIQAGVQSTVSGSPAATVTTLHVSEP